MVIMIMISGTNCTSPSRYLFNTDVSESSNLFAKSSLFGAMLSRAFSIEEIVEEGNFKTFVNGERSFNSLACHGLKPFGRHARM